MFALKISFMKYPVVIYFLISSFSFSFAQTYDELIDLSFHYIDKNELSAAEQTLKEAMRKEPDNPRNVFLLSNLGTVQRREGKKEEALLSYSSALAQTPKSTTLLANRASLYAEMRQTDHAIADYTSLLLVDDKDEQALYERGLLYLSIKDYISAEIDFEKILEVNPNTLSGRKGLATICTLRGQYDEAERIYIFLIDRVSDDPDLYLGRAELYMLINKNNHALADINKAIDLQTGREQRDPYAYILRAQVKLRQYEKISAKKDIEQAITLGYDKKIGEELLKLCK